MNDVPLLLLEVCGIAVFGILGDAARVYLTYGIEPTLTQHTTNVFLPNLIGCFILGMVHEVPWAQVHIPMAPLWLGVGFCGCLTSFSSWVSLAVAKPAAVSAIYEVSWELGVPMTAYMCGRDALCALSPPLPTKDSGAEPASIPHEEASDDSGRQRRSRRGFIATAATLIAAVLVAVAFVTLSATLYNDSDRRVFLYPSLLAPFGAILRYSLGLMWNNRQSLAESFPFNRFESLRSATFLQRIQFPLGTFAANILAFFLVGVLRFLCKGTFGCDAVSVGVGGALSTVSSWAAESVTMYRKPQEDRRMAAYVYALGTATLGIAITGGFEWGYRT